MNGDLTADVEFYSNYNPNPSTKIDTNNNTQLLKGIYDELKKMNSTEASPSNPTASAPSNAITSFTKVGEYLEFNYSTDYTYSPSTQTGNFYLAYNYTFPANILLQEVELNYPMYINNSTASTNGVITWNIKIGNQSLNDTNGGNIYLNSTTSTHSFPYLLPKQTATIRFSGTQGINVSSGRTIRVLVAGIPYIMTGKSVDWKALLQISMRGKYIL